MRWTPRIGPPGKDRRARRRGEARAGHDEERFLALLGGAFADGMGGLIAEHLIELPILACLLACSGFFSGSETALFSLTREQLRRYEKERSRGGDLILGLLKEPKEVLASLLFGNTVVNILFFAVSFRLAEDAAQEGAWVGGVLGFVTLMMVIVFGEVGPKGLAVAHTEAVARLVAGPLTLFHGVVRPVSKVCVRLIGRASCRERVFAVV